MPAWTRTAWAGLLLVAMLTAVVAAEDQCGVAESDTCVRITDTSMTLYPKQHASDSYYHFTLAIESMRQLNSTQEPIEGLENTSFGSCTTSAAKLHSSGKYSEVVVECAGEQVAGSRLITSIRTILVGHTITVNGDDVVLEPGQVKIDYTIDWPDCGTSCLSQYFEIVTRGSWQVPTTYWQLIDSGINSEPLDLNRLVNITDNARGNPSRIQVDAVFALDMRVPDSARICSASAALLQPLACWRRFTSTATASDELTVPIIDANVPSAVVIKTRWQGISSSMWIDPAISVDVGQLAAGSLDIKFMLIVSATVLGLILLCCCLICCLACSCCPLAKRCSKSTQQQHSTTTVVPITQQPSSRTSGTSGTSSRAARGTTGVSSRKQPPPSTMFI